MPSLEDAVATIFINERVCPTPIRWNSLYELLCKVAEEKGVDGPLTPLILGAWWHSPPAEKADRLKSHLSWASDHGVLEQALSFLARIPESDWVHVADAPSGKGGYDYLDEVE